MTTFNETDVVRDGAGKFSEQHHSEPPGVSLSPASKPSIWSRDSPWNVTRGLYRQEADKATGGAETDYRQPGTRSEARRLLRNTRGSADGSVRQVHLEHTNAPDSKTGEFVDISSPKDGRPIIVSVGSGLPRLRVTPGSRALIRFDSTWGNSLTVPKGAEATVVGASDIKISIDVEEGGKLTVICDSDDNRMRIYKSKDAQVETRYGTGREEPAPAPAPAAESDDEYDPFEDEDNCSCGASLDDGEGFDGMCGNCADRSESELFQADVTDADGNDPGYTVHKDEYDDQYRVLDEDGDTILEFDYLGDEEAHDEIQATMIRAFQEQKGTALYDEEHPIQEGTAR